MDYMAEGLDVELVVAIDFTKSNGDPTDPRFLLVAADIFNIVVHKLTLLTRGDLVPAAGAGYLEMMHRNC
jgi:hypothetical protein